MKLEKELDKLKKVDEKLRHKPVTLYCLGCGKIISKEFTGGLWSYTCVCKDNYRNNKKPSLSRAFGSVEFGILYPTSLILHRKFKNCTVCKTLEEHEKRTLKEYLGRLYEDFKIKDKKVIELRNKFIKLVKEIIK